MYKVIGILKRPEGISLETFHQWWLNEHTKLAKKFPGLKKYVINLSTSGDQRFDGVAEVWFESKEAMENAFATPEGQAARRSATTYSQELVVLFTEEHIVVNG